MRSTIPQRSIQLLGLVTSIALLGIGAIWPMPPAGVVPGSRSSHGFAAITDRAPIEPLAPAQSPRRDADPGRVSPGDAKIRPLVDLFLLTAPTAAGASLVAERLTYAPGAALSVQRYTQVRVVSLTEGSLDASIDGVAFLDRRWPTGSLLVSEPQRVAGNIRLYPGDLLAIPAEVAFTTQNPGEVLAVSLDLSVRLPRLLTPMTDRIGAVRGTAEVRSERLGSTIAMAPGISMVISVGRVILPAGGSFMSDGTAGLAVFVVERGHCRCIREGQEVDRAPGDVELVPRRLLSTISNTSEAPLGGVLLTITPAEFGKSTV
jgi:mannose-6-phosphate isomerase-like protein (cupin superfamily)